MFYNSTKATVAKEGVWNEQTCIRRTGGFDIDKTNLPEGTKYLPKGAVLALVNNKAVAVKTAKVYENAAKAATSVKVEKEHILKVGDVLGDSAAIAAITIGDTIDTLTLGEGGLSADVKAGDVITDANVAKIIGLNYATIKLDDMPSCTPTIQAYEIEEDTLPYPVNDAIKTALTSRHDWKV